MSVEDQIRWNRKHAASGPLEAPSAFLREILESDAWRIPPGKALDLACGKGRNAIFLAAGGFEVTGIDISPAGLDEGRRRAVGSSLTIDWRQCDLEQIELAVEDYDLIVQCNYWQRSLIAPIKRAIRRGGYVVCETYLIDQQTLGHPHRPDFLLAHNELLDHFREFRVLLYREGKFAHGTEPAFRAGLLAQRI